VITNLRRAGAVIVGRSNTPAFSMRWYTDNELHGRTLNPWRADRTPGGSSGGAAAAVATGMCAIGHGNDGGGSTRYPAYCTGTVGLRASFGRVPAFNATATSERQLSLQWLSIQGAITRNVADSRLALEAMAVADPRDPWFVPAPLVWPASDCLPCVAVCYDPAGVGIAEAVRAHVLKAANVLTDAGYLVDAADPPDVAAAATGWNDFAQGESRVSLADTVARHGDASARRAFELMMARTPVLDVAGLMRVSASRATLLRNWQLFMEGHPLVLCPVAMEQALPYGVDVESAASVERLYRSHTFLFATAFLGLPSISVPTGVVDGVPIGVQIIGRRFREDMVLDAAQAIEDDCGSFTPIDPSPAAG
jgi:amidase